MATANSDLTYPALVRELFPRLTGGIRWGLDRTHQLLASVGNPQDSYRTVHIAGTNGKGSVAATLASILQRMHGRVGLYTSPHLCTLRERMQIGGAPISEAEVVDAAHKLWPAVQRLDPSFFETTTAIGLLAFAEAGVDFAVIEVGLGGRLDATNVIMPELSVITNISLDHAEYLGSTLSSVATEKAGIIKPGVPMLTAETELHILEIFHARAAQLYAPAHVMHHSEVRDISCDRRGTSFTINWRGRPQRLRTPLVGTHQAINAALAVRAAELLALDLDASHLHRGIEQIRWSGRLQMEAIAGQTWIFDVAHNVAGVQSLADTLPQLVLPRPLVLVLGILGDKDWQAMLPPLFALADKVILTAPPTAPPARVWNPQLALAHVSHADAQVMTDFAAALEHAHVAAGTGSVLVTGSFHTVGDALICLNRTPFGSDVTLPRVSFAG